MQPGYEPPGNKTEQRERDQHQPRLESTEPESVPRRRWRLDVPGDEAEQQIHGDSAREHRKIRRCDGRMAQRADVYERILGARFQDHPTDKEHHRDDQNSGSERRVVIPHTGLADHEEKPHQRARQQDCASDVDPDRRARRSGRKDHDRDYQRSRCDSETERVGGPDPREVGEQPGEWVTHTYPSCGGHRQQRDCTCRSTFGKVFPSHGHHQRRESESHPLRRAPDQQDRERHRKRRQRAARGDNRQRPDHHRTTTRARPEPTEDRRAHGTREQRDGQRPLRRSERNVIVGGYRGDQRSAEAPDDGDDQSDEDQSGDQRRPLVPR